MAAFTVVIFLVVISIVVVFVVVVRAWGDNTQAHTNTLRLDLPVKSEKRFRLLAKQGLITLWNCPVSLSTPHANFFAFVNFLSFSLSLFNILQIGIYSNH